MNELEQARDRIDRIDREIAALFEQRMDTLEAVGRYKRLNSLPIFDSGREKAVVERNLALLNNPDYVPYYRDFIEHLMELSKRYQRKAVFSGEIPENTMRIPVCLKDKFYDIILKRGVLSHLAEYMNLNRKVLVVTDEGVPAEYAQTVLSQCENGHLAVVPQGEGSKSFPVFEQLSTKLLSLRFGRKDLVIALGGGVVGDLAGFVAASYMRGLSFVNIPTTTLSQIDSSIGGKTAINLDGVKNIVGAFYQPDCVVIDSDTLSTLPMRHFNNGLIEAVKAGLIRDKDILSLFEQETLPLDEIIRRAVLVKRDVVEADETEQNLRQILNFGHTIGHAIESCYALSGLLHGEAVAAGMLPMIGENGLKQRILQIFDRLSVPTDIPYDKEKVFSYLTGDKKTAGDHITIVKVSVPGQAVLEMIPIEDLRAYL